MKYFNNKKLEIIYDRKITNSTNSVRLTTKYSRLKSLENFDLEKYSLTKKCLFVIILECTPFIKMCRGR